MDEYSALRDAPFSAAELEELTKNMCEPRVVEVNSREPELRSGRTLRGAKHAKLPPRVEQHYAPLAEHVMGLFKQHEAGVSGASEELVFILRCLKLAESKCGSYLPDVLEELRFRDDDEVQLVGSSSGSDSVGKAKADVIDVQNYIIECLIVGEKKPDPKELDALSAESLKLKTEPGLEALPPTAVLASSPPPPIESQDEDENGPLWDIGPEFIKITSDDSIVQFDSGGDLDSIDIGAVSVSLFDPTPVEVAAFFSRFKGSSQLLNLDLMLISSSPAINMSSADLPNLRRLGIYIDEARDKEDTPWEKVEALSQQQLAAVLEASLPRLAWVNLYGWKFISDSVAVLGQSLLPRLKKLVLEKSYFAYQSLDRLTIGNANSWARLKELSFDKCRAQLDSEGNDVRLVLAFLLPMAVRCPNLRSFHFENEEGWPGLAVRGNDGPALITAIKSGYWKDLEVLMCSIDVDDGEGKELHVAEVAIKHQAWPKLRLLCNLENLGGEKKVLKRGFPNIEPYPLSFTRRSVCITE